MTFQQGMPEREGEGWAVILRLGNKGVMNMPLFALVKTGSVLWTQLARMMG